MLTKRFLIIVATLLIALIASLSIAKHQLKLRKTPFDTPSESANTLFEQLNQELQKKHEPLIEDEPQRVEETGL